MYELIGGLPLPPSDRFFVSEGGETLEFITNKDEFQCCCHARGEQRLAASDFAISAFKLENYRLHEAIRTAQKENLRYKNLYKKIGKVLEAIVIWKKYRSRRVCAFK